MSTVFKITNTDYNTDDKFIFCVHWTASKTVDGFSASTYSTQSFTKKDGLDLIPYTYLSEGIVIEWVMNAIGDEGLAAIDAALDAQIAEQQAPKKATGTPWGQA